MQRTVVFLFKLTLKLSFDFIKNKQILLKHMKLNENY